MVNISGYLFLHRSGSRIFRPKMEHLYHKQLPQWCHKSEALGLLRTMRANHEDKMSREVFADWLEQFVPDGQVHTIREQDDPGTRPDNGPTDYPSSQQTDHDTEVRVFFATEDGKGQAVRALFARG